MTSTTPRVAGKRGPQSYLPSHWAALALLASAQLMLVLDVTVVNVALPDIAVALHLQRGELPWVMTIYTVFFGGLMLLGGRGHERGAEALQRPAGQQRGGVAG